MKGNKKTNEAHVLGKTERDASGEWTLRTQTGAIVAVVGAVVILLSHYPYVLNAVAAVLGILGINELLHALSEWPGGKFCVSVFRQNQESHIIHVHDWGLFPLSTSFPGGWDGMCAGTA